LYALAYIGSCPIRLLCLGYEKDWRKGGGGMETKREKSGKEKNDSMFFTGN